MFLTFTLVTSGCGKGKEAAQETETVVKEYSNAVTKAPSKTKVLTELASIRKAIKMYKVENEKYPEELSDLPVKIKEPEEYKYNPETGKVKSKFYPNL